MSDEPLEEFERQFAAMQLSGSPAGLRGLVLRDVQRELRAARWDRRLARAAAVLLVIGVGMNVAMGIMSDGVGARRLDQGQQAVARPSLVDTAVVVAEATDAMTARHFARQMAAMAGRELSVDEAAAIDAAIRRPAARSTPGGKG
jgi:hypothetical protein